MHSYKRSTKASARGMLYSSFLKKNELVYFLEVVSGRVAFPEVCLLSLLVPSRIALTLLVITLMNSLDTQVKILISS